MANNSASSHDVNLTTVSSSAPLSFSNDTRHQNVAHVDRELIKLTKMLEVSTKELSHVNTAGSVYIIN